MADYATNATIVDSLIDVGVEERRLQDGCREADFVGGRVVISVDSLRSHVPFGLVYRLVHLA